MNTVMLAGKVETYPKSFLIENKSVSTFKIKCPINKNKFVSIDCVAWNTVSDIVKDTIKMDMTIGITGRLNVRYKINDETDLKIYEVLVDKVFQIENKADFNELEPEE